MYLSKKWIIPFIQVSMALIYLVFGGLKLLGGSPAEELVFLSTLFVDFSWFYPLLGFWEIGIGVSFLVLPFFRKFGFWLFILHMIGTFLPFFTAPELCVGVYEFGVTHPTFTIVGQYIVKNLALVGCGLVLFYSRASSDK